MKKVGETIRPLIHDLNQIPYNYTVEVTNRLKGLDPIECLKNYGQRFVELYRRHWSRPSPRKRNAKKAKWLSEEALQIAVKRREAKSKGEKERYKHLNAEFQRIARRDKKAFLSDQCKEIEEGFLISPCYSLELCIQMFISFLFSFAFGFSSFHRYL